MDINLEDQPESADRAREMVRDCGDLIVHSHLNGEFQHDAGGRVILAAAGYFDERFRGRQVAYPAYVDAPVAAAYTGCLDWENSATRPSGTAAPPASTAFTTVPRWPWNTCDR